MIPAKADPDRQEDFLKEELKPRLKEAEEGRRAVFFLTPPILSRRLFRFFMEFYKNFYQSSRRKKTL